MKEKLKKIDPHKPVGDILYEILSICKNPIHYKEAQEIIVELGYYRVRNIEVPKNRNLFYYAIRCDDRFIKLANGFYGLKEWIPESIASVELEIKCADNVKMRSESPKYKEKDNHKIENIRELADFNTYSNNNAKLVNEKMSNKETFQEGILPEEVVALLQRYCNAEEFEDAIQRAKKEYYDLFIPKFVAQEMNRVIEKNKI